MSLDTPLRKVAKTVLGKFGSSGTIRRVTGTGYNTTLRKMTPVTTDYVVKGRLENYVDRDFSDTIHAGDRQWTIAAVDIPFTPTVDDVVDLADGLTYEIVNVKPEMATNQAAIFVLQLRR